jgi:hypothetical protein
MLEAETRALGFVGATFDLPAVREDNLLHDRQTQAGALLRGGEVGFEDRLPFGTGTPGPLSRTSKVASVAEFLARISISPFGATA